MDNFLILVLVCASVFLGWFQYQLLDKILILQTENERLGAKINKLEELSDTHPAVAVHARLSAELQRKHIRCQESIQLLRTKDEKQEKRIEELEKVVQVEHEDMSEFISPDKGDKPHDKEENVPGSSSEVKDSKKKVGDSGLEHLKNTFEFLITGRHQTAKVVAFHATIDADSHLTKLTTGQAIVFDSVHLNVGEGYHSSVGLFVAPTGGLYMFSLSIMLNIGAPNWLVLDLIKNGNDIARAYAYGYDQGSVSMVTQLDMGDEVLVKVGGPNDAMLYGGKLSSFMGVLIH